MGCSLCGSSKSETLFGVRDGFTYIRCNDCNYIHVTPIPDKEELDRYYDKAFFDENYNPQTAIKLYKQRKIQYRQDLALLQKYLPEGKVLDYGCGNGEFLIESNYDVVGYEPNKSATSAIPKADLIREHKFDGIVLRGVIEHFRYPTGTIHFLTEMLDKGGIFFIGATPNSDSPVMLNYGLEWRLANPPYHLHMFNPRNLSILFGRLNFELLHIEYPYYDTPYRTENDGYLFCRRIGTNTMDGAPAYPGSIMNLVFRKL